MGTPAVVVAQTAANATNAAGEKAVTALETLFELGLPDSRGAKWVAAQSWNTPFESPVPGERYGRATTGNAWLLKEHPNGEVELLINQTQRLRARRAKRGEDQFPQPGQAPSIQIEPAEVDKDLAALTKVLIDLAKPKAGNDDRDYGDYQRQRTMLQLRSSLLFLAHLQRQGRTDAVQKVLPSLLAAAKSSDALLDGALELLAEGRMKSLCDAWVAGGNAEDYARGIEAVVAEISRGWPQRDAARQLVNRLRQQAPGKRAQEPAAQKAAQMLLALKPGQIHELPLGRNWFLPGEDGESLVVTSPRGTLGLRERLRSLLGRTPPAPNQPAELKTATGTAAFFQNKREAAMGLAQLLDDQRFLRATLPSDENGPDFDFGNRFGQQAQDYYASVPRPSELGEMAEQLLNALLPEDLQELGGDRAGKMERVLAWLREVARLNDEELAWHFMRKASDAESADFTRGLNFLVKNGGPETLKKLEEVFLDPAVWAGDGDSMPLPQLGQYIKRLGGEGGAASARIEPAIKAAIEAASKARLAQYGTAGSSMQKHFEKEKDERLKALGQILRPRGWSEILEGMTKLSNVEEAGAELETLRTALGDELPPGAEAKIYQAAAASKSTDLRTQLVSLLAGAELPADPKLDPATREALLTLLADESSRPMDGWNQRTPVASVAETTARLFLSSRGSEDDAEKWSALEESVPSLVGPWMRAQAVDLVKTGKVPPVPDAGRVASDRLTALLKELESAKPAEALAAVRAKQPDEQLALVKHLGEAKQWPASLRAAHLTIHRVDSVKYPKEAPDLKIDFMRWKGRIFDSALHAEILAEVEKSMLGGGICNIQFQSAGPLSGLSMTVVAYPGGIDLKFLKQFGVEGLDNNKELPAGAIVQAYSAGKSGEALSYTGYAYPVWKDARLTDAWKAEYLKPGAKLSPSTSPRFKNDPAACTKWLADWPSLPPNQRGAVTFGISAHTIKAGAGTAKDGPSEETEEDENEEEDTIEIRPATPEPN